MTRLFILLAALAIASPALAAPYGQARVLPVRSQAQDHPGYRLARPDLLATASGVRAHGMICREAGHAGLPVRSVRVQHLDPAGRVLDVVEVRVDFDSVRRSASCTAYDLATAWKIDPADTVLASAL
ncbi:MAG: hypothetical protein KA220_04990 [Phenylobacterium sp.]|jgi:hypothetical protein|nr:hypothetical protein [Phenylobacterium sp.]MBP8248323.1 hypothetical protein [Phenylobacterium sp.]